MNIDFRDILQVEQFLENPPRGFDLAEFDSYLKEARNELLFYDWCVGIEKSYVGLMVPGIVGVFLFEINPAVPETDKYVWVVVGDLPPAYITAENSPNFACALDAYVGAMEEWVEAAESDASVSNLIPVNLEATRENAKQLKIRLNLLQNRTPTHR